jgi:hypothetical protein
VRTSGNAVVAVVVMLRRVLVRRKAAGRGPHHGRRFDD